MTSSSDAPRIAIAHPDRIFVGGEWRQPSTDRKLKLIAPATEQVIVEVAEGVEADVDAAVAAARAAFDTGPWPRMSPRERGAHIQRLADELRKRVPDLANAWTQQVGVPFGWSSANTAAGIGFYDYYASLGDSFAWEEERPTYFPGQKGMVVREAVGVVAAIAPWNAPLFTMSNKVAPALIAGCTLILKPSPETPLEAYILAECAEAAGLPPGVINMVATDRAASEHLVRNPGVDKVSFTGSSAAGKKIASICGERIARVTLELGGKSAAILLDDYDIDVAAAELAQNGCLLAGQVCANLTRFIVPKAKHDAFTDAFAAQFSAIRVGDPYDPETQMGPLAMKRQLDKVIDYIDRGKAEGARLVTGGGRPAHLNQGYFIEPTVFANVDNRSTISQEEIFGPVVCITPYDDLDHAIAMANDSVFGLNGSVFTNDDALAYRVSRAIRTGTMGQNGSRTDFSIGFGGFKQSGVGREGGPDGVLPFLESKTVVLNTLPAHIAA